MNASKQRGTRWESEIVRYLNENGWPHVERRTLSGSSDRGDIAGLHGDAGSVVIEAKNQNRQSLAEWIDEAEAEGDNARARVAVVWAHRKGKSSAGAGYVVMTGEQFTELLKMAGF